MAGARGKHSSYDVPERRRHRPQKESRRIYDLRNESRGGVNYNEKSETSVRGLYAAGDEFGFSISNAATFGFIAGENAAKYVGKVESLKLEKVKGKVEEKKRLCEEIRNREEGASWREVNIALQQIMNDYAGAIRSETLLKAGLGHLHRLKEKAYDTMMAQNQHELMRCLEVLDLLDVAELVFIAANERKETRGKHIRPDYPFANPLLDNKILVIKKMGDKPVTEWREVKH